MSIPTHGETAVAPLAPGDLAVSGERLLGAERLSAARAGASVPGAVLVGADGLDQAAAGRLEDGGGATALAAAARAIVKATGKPEDGIVSRAMNRPISRAMSGFLLRWPAIRPGHATCLTALIALAMAAALVFGGKGGLIAGALLYQLASIIDGVDGEIARATFRATQKGARLDSLVDAATNLGFIAGVSWNLFIRGQVLAALAGASIVAMVALGLTLLGWRRSRPAGLDFDAAKHRLNARPSAWRTWLIWLTMRDFLALLATLTIVFGFAHILLIGFTAITAGWLVVIVAVTARQAA